MTSAKNLICGITRRKNRRKKAEPKETIEIQPKIKEEIIKEEIEEVTVEVNDDTPKDPILKEFWTHGNQFPHKRNQKSKHQKSPDFQSLTTSKTQKIPRRQMNHRKALELARD